MAAETAAAVAAAAAIIRPAMRRNRGFARRSPVRQQVRGWTIPTKGHANRGSAAVVFAGNPHRISGAVKFPERLDARMHTLGKPSISGRRSCETIRSAMMALATAVAPCRRSFRQFSLAFRMPACGMTVSGVPSKPRMPSDTNAARRCVNISALADRVTDGVP